MVAEWTFSIINKGIVGSHQKKNSFDGLKVRQQNSNTLIIKQRIKQANARFHSNDNISEYINPGELELLQDEVARKLQQVLNSLIIDTKNDHNTRETAKRVAKMYVQEIFAGRFYRGSCFQMPNRTYAKDLFHVCDDLKRVVRGVRA